MWFLRCVAAFAASAWAANARQLRTANGALDSAVNTGKARFVASKVRYDLNLADLKASQRADGKKKYGTFLVNASVNGQEVACLSCNPQLFNAWLQQLREPPRSANVPKPAKKAEVEVVQNDKEGKHPGSPGYEEWARQRRSLGLLGRSANLSVSMNESSNLETKSEDSHTAAVMITDLDDVQIAAMKQRFHTLWKDRRLLLGLGAQNPMEENLDFVDALVDLARESPALTATDCGDQSLPLCNSLFSGKKTATGTELQDALDTTFGAEFLRSHRRDPARSAAEERESVKALLKALKSNFTFYYQKCLNSEPGAESCNTKADSELVGQLACKPEDDEPSDDCVYAELRLCRDCAEQQRGPGGRLFEYSRFHGPLALLETRRSRGRVMGQCEEFSRAGHALLAALGYEVRYVLDFTDHVWIEVKLPSGDGGKWLHADPSEGILDEPLMYEKGWGKKLTMIFAFTPSYVENVTPTYTADYKKTVWRRGVSEESLKDVLAEANHRLSFQPTTKWGHQSADRDLGNIALWSHFEGASIKL